MPSTIRFIAPEEIDAQRERYKAKYPLALEPNWASVLVQTDKAGLIVGMAEIGIPVQIAMLDADNPLDTVRMMSAVDGWLAGKGVNEYRFVVPDLNLKFQQMVEKHYGLEGLFQYPSKVYIVRR